MSDTSTKLGKARDLVLKDLLAYIEAASSISVHDAELGIDKSNHYRNANTLLGMYSKLEKMVDPVVVSKDEEDKRLIEEASNDIEAIMSKDESIPKSKVLVNKLSPIKR